MKYFCLFFSVAFTALFIFAPHKTESGEAATFVMAMMFYGFAMVLDKLDQLLEGPK